MTYYERRLPHWQPDDTWLFVTWRLYGTLPICKRGDGCSPGQAFRNWDRELDLAAAGPQWLKIPVVAESVSNALLSAAYQWNRYELRAWVIMPNHVHALILPKIEAFRCLCIVKSGSGREANRILGRVGQPFWQVESYDHWVRDGDEFGHVVRYIEYNPVKAGLAERPESWPWSSASRG